MDVEDAVASGLCDVMQEALISRGIDPEIAKVLAERACKPTVGRAVKGTKRRVSKYARKYKRAFARVANKYKLKSGAWRVGGFDKAVKEAHKLAKKMK